MNNEDQIRNLQWEVATLKEKMKGNEVMYERFHSEFLQEAHRNQERHKEVMERLSTVSNDQAGFSAVEDYKKKVIKWSIAIVGLVVAAGWFAGEADGDQGYEKPAIVHKETNKRNKINVEVI